jgi:hypothetical protein
MKTKLITTLLATIAVLGAGSALTASMVLPPPYIRVLITAEYAPTQLEVGRVYAVHTRRLANGTYGATIVDSAGNRIYSDLPVWIQGCEDPKTVWPERGFGVVKPKSSDDRQASANDEPSRDDESSKDDEGTAVLDITAPELKSCHMEVTAPVDPWMPSGDK